MSTPREIFLETIRPDGRPERILDQYEALGMVLNDPINTYLRGNRARGVTSVDRWGTTIIWPEDAPGAMPYHSPELTVLQDITRWRETVHAPDIERECASGWEAARAAAEAVRGEKLATGFMGTGIFEQCHFLMGFEDTLSNLYEHPDEMHELIEYITAYRMKYAEMLIDNLHPDAILSHDDWGTKDALFMSPDMWREFFKEPYRRFYGLIRSRGVIAIHHGDAYLADIVEDMAEIGVQCWQGVLPENNIPELQKRLGGRMALMGGIGAAIDRADATEVEIRAYVRKALEDYTPGGHFIPSITYGLPGAVFPQVDAAIDAEIADWNGETHLHGARRAAVVRRGRAVSGQEGEQVLCHPAADDTVIRGDDHGHEGCQPAEEAEAPVEFFVRADAGQARFTADRDLGDHERKAECDHEHQIDQQENTAAILRSQIGEAPQVAQAHRGACRRQHEADAAGETASRFLFHILLFTPLHTSLSILHCRLAAKRDKAIPHNLAGSDLREYFASGCGAFLQQYLMYCKKAWAKYGHKISAKRRRHNCAVLP